MVPLFGCCHLVWSVHITIFPVDFWQRERSGKILSPPDDQWKVRWGGLFQLRPSSRFCRITFRMLQWCHCPTLYRCFQYVETCGARMWKKRLSIILGGGDYYLVSDFIFSPSAARRQGIDQKCEAKSTTMALLCSSNPQNNSRNSIYISQHHWQAKEEGGALIQRKLHLCMGTSRPDKMKDFKIKFNNHCYVLY